ncbi:MAG: ABC transporter permease [Armatimonadetes bacterium]|nr:ABC transporter permease [Armatimonadota bacterium]
MARYILRRILESIPLLIGVSVITFALLMLAPGDPIAFLVPPEQMQSVDRRVLEEQLGLDKPAPVQYVQTMTGLLSGRLRSFRERRPTLEMMGEAMPATVILTLCALAVAFALALPIAIISAVRPYSLIDHVATVTSLLGVSLPNFWFALVLIFIFTDQLGWLPASGIRPVGVDGYPVGVIWRYLIMPTIVMALSILPPLVRYARSSLLDVLSQDYIRVARSKGLSEPVVLIKHALRNSLIPVATVLGLLLPFLLGGSVIVETIFAVPGVGMLAVTSALTRDYPVVMTTTMIASALVVVSNLLTDVSYALLDPRIRHD